MVEEAISFWSEIQRFENMLAADPRSLSFAPLSELYRKLGLLDDAISVAKKGCNLHPDYPGGFFALGAACIDKGLKEEARPALERVIQLNPEHVRALKLLSQLYVESGETALARTVLQQVLEQNPDDTESSLMLHSLAPAPELAAPEATVSEAEFAEAEVTELLAVEEIGEEEEIEELEPIEDLIELLDEPLEPAAVSGGLAAPQEAEPFEFIEEVAELEPTAAESPAPQPPRNPLTTPTFAELYVSQGFLDKAIAIYQELIASAPDNQGYRQRCTELKLAQERQREQATGATDTSLEAPAFDEEDYDFDEEGSAGEEAVPTPKPGIVPQMPAPAPREPAASAAQAADASWESVTVLQAVPSWQEPVAAGQKAVPSFEETTPAAQQTASEPEEAASAGDAEAELYRWLENIRRRKDGL